MIKRPQAELVAVRILNAIGRPRRGGEEWNMALETIKKIIEEEYPQGPKEDHHGPKQGDYVRRSLKRE